MAGGAIPKMPKALLPKGVKLEAWFQYNSAFASGMQTTPSSARANAEKTFLSSMQKHLDALGLYEMKPGTFSVVWGTGQMRCAWNIQRDSFSHSYLRWLMRVAWTKLPHLDLPVAWMQFRENGEVIPFASLPLSRPSVFGQAGSSSEVAPSVPSSSQQVVPTPVPGTHSLPERPQTLRERRAHILQTVPKGLSENAPPLLLPALPVPITPASSHKDPQSPLLSASQAAPADSRRRHSLSTSSYATRTAPLPSTPTSTTISPDQLPPKRKREEDDLTSKSSEGPVPYEPPPQAPVKRMRTESALPSSIQTQAVAQTPLLTLGCAPVMEIASPASPNISSSPRTPLTPTAPILLSPRTDSRRYDDDRDKRQHDLENVSFQRYQLNLDGVWSTRSSVTQQRLLKLQSRLANEETIHKDVTSSLEISTQTSAVEAEAKESAKKALEEEIARHETKEKDWHLRGEQWLEKERTWEKNKSDWVSRELVFRDTEKTLSNLTLQCKQLEATSKKNEWLWREKEQQLNSVTEDLRTKLSEAGASAQNMTQKTQELKEEQKRLLDELAGLRQTTGDQVAELNIEVTELKAKLERERNINQQAQAEQRKMADDLAQARHVDEERQAWLTERQNLLTDLSDACASREAVDIEKKAWPFERQKLLQALSEERARCEVLQEERSEAKRESDSTKASLEAEIARLRLVCEGHQRSIEELTLQLQRNEQSRKVGADALVQESEARMAVERLLEKERQARRHIEGNIECLKGVPSVIQDINKLGSEESDYSTLTRIIA